MDGVFPRHASGKNGQLAFLLAQSLFECMLVECRDFFLNSVHSAYTLAFAFIFYLSKDNQSSRKETKEFLQ
jgi:hypothetical protein